MKRMLLATTALIALAPAARAQLAVYDNASIIQAAQHWGQAAQYWTTQGSQMMTQINELRSTYNALTGPRPMGAIAGILADQGIQMPGISNYEIADAIHGGISWGGAANLVRRNLYALPQGTDPEAREMERRRQAYANLQADADASFAAIDQRMHAIDQLRAKASQTQDLKESSDLNARIAAENAALQNARDRAERTVAAMQAQRDVDAMREREMSRQHSQQWYDATRDVWNVRW